MTYSIRDRILSRIDASGPCWLWTGGTSHGYGHVKIDGRAHPVHRVVWELLIGPIPTGLELDHLCRVRACCNPDHLEPVTRQANVLRSPEHTHRRGWSKTHCPHGHKYTYRSDGRRHCTTCRRVARKARKATHEAPM